MLAAIFLIAGCSGSGQGESKQPPVTKKEKKGVVKEYTDFMMSPVRQKKRVKKEIDAITKKRSDALDKALKETAR